VLNSKKYIWILYVLQIIVQLSTLVLICKPENTLYSKQNVTLSEMSILKLGIYCKESYKLAGRVKLPFLQVLQKFVAVYENLRY
jgi:hypothetical protein